MGLFSNTPIYELGEQKYYRYLQAAHKHSSTTAMLASKIRGLSGLLVHIVPITADSPDFVIRNLIFLSLKQMY